VLDERGIASAHSHLAGEHAEDVQGDEQDQQIHRASPPLNNHSSSASAPQRHGVNSAGGMPPARAVDQEMENAPQELQRTDLGLSPLLDGWSHEIQPQYPSWQVRDDFDWEAFNLSLLVPMSVDETAWIVPPPSNQPASASRPEEVIQSPSPASMDVIMGLWVTRADDANRKADGISYSLAPTRPATPNNMSPGTVDERYRDDLSNRLRPRWKEEPLPSTEFLVCYLILLG
jgi:hypothetical protein